ncbi:MAG TPA: hypothetical protein PKB04_11985 [Phenylobacterium sp.]|nr:hypothetical protein [Phenylobacterium sp.]
MADPEHAQMRLWVQAAAEAAWRQGQDGRAQGVVWSALHSPAPEPPVASAIEMEAEARLALRRAWRASPEGRLTLALADLQTAARRLDHEAERLREAAARGLGGRAPDLRSLARPLADLRKAARQRRPTRRTPWISPPPLRPSTLSAMSRRSKPRASQSSNACCRRRP